MSSNQKTSADEVKKEGHLTPKEASRIKRSEKRSLLTNIVKNAPALGSIVRGLDISGLFPLSRQRRSIGENTILMSSVSSMLNAPKQERTETIISIVPASKMTRLAKKNLSKKLYHDLVLNLVKYDEKAPAVIWPWTELVTVVNNFISRVHEYVTDSNILSALSNTPQVISKKLIKSIEICAFEEDDCHMCPLHGPRGDRITKEHGTLTLRRLSLKNYARDEINLNQRSSDNDVTGRYLKAFQFHLPGLCFCAASSCSLPHPPFEIPKPPLFMPHNPLIAIPSIQQQKRNSMTIIIPESKQSVIDVNAREDHGGKSNGFDRSQEASSPTLSPVCCPSPITNAIMAITRTAIVIRDTHHKDSQKYMESANFILSVSEYMSSRTG
jgi:hypothetical protein